MILKADSAGRLRDEAGRFARDPGEGFQLNGEVGPPRARGGRRLFGSVAEVMRGMLRLVQGILVNSDVAFRRDRNLQRMMRHDPDVMGPLQQRQLAVALLDFSIVPEDENDKQQGRQADEIKDLITRHCPRRHDLWRHLLEAVWYGPSAANIIYGRVRTPDGTRTTVVDWIPFQPDTLVFTETGELGMRVGARYEGPKVASWEGFVHLLRGDERAATILHTWQRQGPDYEELEQGRYLYAGRGLRDVVWFQWLMKQTAMQLWMLRVEKYAAGVPVGHYPSGNDTAADDMEEALRNLGGDNMVIIPNDGGVDGADGRKSKYRIETLDLPADQNRVFADLIEGYLAGQIKELIIGQSATTEATNTGLGSEVATRHAETFNRLVRYDAETLADTLTSELVAPLHRMNFGETPYRPRFEFSLELVNSKDFMESVRAYYDIGGVVSDRQLRKLIGLELPKDDDDKLGRDPMEMGAFGGQGAFGGMAANPNRLREALAGNGSPRSNGQTAAAT